MANNGPIVISDPPGFNNPTAVSTVPKGTVTTGPAMPTAPVTLPPATQVGIGPRLPTAPLSGNTGIVPPAQGGGLQGQPPFSFGAGNVVQDYLNQLTSSNSPYMRNAKLRGLEVAGQRGTLNSSIAGGSAQRAALEAAQPFVSEMMGLHKSREGYAAQDWLSNNQFEREFSATLALLPIKSSFDMLNTLMSYGADNPSVYTPTVMSGLSNFFTQNMQDIMSQYFPQRGNP